MSTRSIKSYFKIIFIFISISSIAYSCANMASPQGGDYDFDAPVVIKSTPTPNQLNVTSRRIEIIFDELVQIEKPLEKVIITPPQTSFPLIRAQSNKVIVELKDTLQKNTTYTIDFTDAIADNNEKNPLENFSISFSTGNYIDSLQISGKVLAAENLEPVAGIYVGIHSDLADSAFTTKPFLRISRTNEFGSFSIKGVAEGKYKIYALDDLDRDYKYDYLGEAIAFYDTIITPSTEMSTKLDSVFTINPTNIKELRFDSLVTTKYTKYLPNDIVLRSFKTPLKRQYLQKHERLERNSLSIFFGAETELPKIKALNTDIEFDEWAVLERNITNDTLKYWITDKNIVNLDTLTLQVTFYETDTLGVPQLKTDTLNFIDRTKSKKKEDKKKGDKEEETVFLGIQSNATGVMDIFRTVSVIFDAPVTSFDSSKIKVEQVVDTIQKPIDFSLVKDSLNPRKYDILYKWNYGDSYKINIDSATVCVYDSSCNNKLDLSFKIKNQDQYGNLFINIYSLPDSVPAFVELLDKTDKPVRRAEVKDGGALFMNLAPGTYYARIILDANANGVWDPGNYEAKVEPEMVYYYNKSFEIKANWDLEEDWDITATPIDKQKPLEITKNKPQTDEAKRKKIEQRDAQNQKNNNRKNNNINSQNNVNAQNNMRL